MQSPEPVGAPTAGSVPRWVAWILIVGAIALVGWAWYVAGFLSEPSAIGRSRLALLIYAGYGGLAALSGIGAAVGVIRKASWGRRAAVVAAVLMTLTCTGALAGVPALLGVLSSRGPSSN